MLPERIQKHSEKRDAVNESCPNYCYDVFVELDCANDASDCGDEAVVICAGNVMVIANDLAADVP